MDKYKVLNGGDKSSDSRQGRERYIDALARRPSRRFNTGDLVVIGATTLAGVGLGLVAAVAGAFAVGAMSEAILGPTLLLKIAGGMAGGGVGMAKGIKDTRNPDEQ